MRFSIGRFVALVTALTAVLGNALGAEEVEGEWTLVPLTMAVETVDADELLGEAERLRSGPNLTLGAPLEETTLLLTVDREAGTLALFGDSLSYHMDGDRFVAEEDGNRIEFLFTPIGDAVLCEIVYRWPQFHAVLIAEAVPGPDAVVVPFGAGGSSDRTAPRGETGALAGSRFVHTSGDIALEFRESRVRISMMGQDAGAFPYQVEGEFIYIDDPSAGTVEFERIDNDTLYCEAMGLIGFYERE